MTADYSNVRVDAKSSMGPWTPRIGATATRLRNMWRRTVRLGVWLLLGLPVTVVAIWRAIQLNSGGAMVALAVRCSVPLSAAVIGLSLLPVAAIRRSEATDAATAYLRQDFDNVVPSEVRLWLRSPLTFDTGVAELAHHGRAVGTTVCLAPIPGGTVTRTDFRFSLVRVFRQVQSWLWGVPDAV